MANQVIDRTWLEDRSLTVQTVDRIKGQHARRIALNQNYLRKRYDLPDVDMGQDPRLDPDQPLQRRGYNLSAEIIDSAASQICRPMKCSLVPVGGDPETTQNCKVKNRLIDGIMDATGFLNVATRQYLDHCTTDLGVHAWDWRNGEFTVQRMLANQLFWEMDRSETPNALFYDDYVSRQILLARYSQNPKKRDVILDLGREAPPRIDGVDIEASGSSHDTDTVRVVRAEAPTVGSRKGRYVLAVKGAVLEDQEWDYPRTRFVVSRWAKDYRGFSGVPLMRRIEPYHDRVRFLQRRIDQALRAIVPTIVAVEEAAADATFSDIDFNKIVYPLGAVEPKIYTPSGLVSADLLHQQEREYARAAAEAGSSQTLATGGGPTSITSGKGLREYVAIANQRLVMQMYVWTQIWVDAAEVIIMLGDAVFSKSGKDWEKKMNPIKAPVAGGDWIEEIKWLGPNDLEKSMYSTRMKPSSGMSSTISGKFDDINNLQELGVASPAIVARAVSDTMPDVASISDELNSPLDYADYLIGKAIDEGVFEPPTTIAGQHLNTILTKAQSRFLRAQTQKARIPKENMGALWKLIAALQSRIAGQPQPAPVAAPAAAPAPVQQPVAA